MGATTFTTGAANIFGEFNPIAAAGGKQVEAGEQRGLETFIRGPFFRFQLKAKWCLLAFWILFTIGMGIAAGREAHGQIWSCQCHRSMSSMVRVAQGTTLSCQKFMILPAALTSVIKIEYGQDRAMSMTKEASPERAGQLRGTGCSPDAIHRSGHGGEVEIGTEVAASKFRKPTATTP
jgi:hypothetical protein